MERVWSEYQEKLFLDEDPLQMFLGPTSMHSRSLLLLHPKPNLILPLFQEKAATSVMMKHSMGIVRSVSTTINLRQIPVFTVDLPLYGMA